VTIIACKSGKGICKIVLVQDIAEVLERDHLEATTPKKKKRKEKGKTGEGGTRRGGKKVTFQL